MLITLRWQVQVLHRAPKIKAIDLVISTGSFMRSENKSKYQIYIPLYNHTMWVKSERVEHLIE